MELIGEYTIPAARKDVWAALNDPEVLKLCVPGCESMEKTSETEFVAKVTMKVGAVKARLKGNVQLSDIDAPNSYTITGQGQGGVAGFAKGGSKVSLTDGDGGTTILHYEATAELGGKLAAVGSRVIQGIAKKMADDFFGKFAAHLSDGVPAQGAAPAASSAPPTPTAPAAQSASTAPNTPSQNCSGTARDLLWFSIGIAVGITAALAYFI